MKNNDILLIGGAGLLAYFLFIKPKTTLPGATTTLPQGVTPVSSGLGTNSTSSLIASGGNALTSIINKLTGNGPSASNQIAPTSTPGAGSSNITSGDLTSSLTPITNTTITAPPITQISVNDPNAVNDSSGLSPQDYYTADMGGYESMSDPTQTNYIGKLTRAQWIREGQ